MILITGATGFIGRHLVRRLMDAGLPLRVLIQPRRARRLPWDSEHPHAPEVFSGSLLDDEVVFQAVTGVHTIIHLESALWWGRERELERVEIAGTRNLLAIARSARVGRVIALSQLGATPSSGYVLHRIKGRYEEVVRNSGLAYTIIRPGLVFGEDDAFINHIVMMMRSNPFFFVVPGYGEVVLHPLYIEDLVTALERTLEHIDLVDQMIEIGGPEYTTFVDLLLTVMRVTRRRPQLVSVQPYLMRLITGLYSRLFPRALMTSQWLDILATNRTAKLGNIYTYYGFHPRRFEDTLVNYLPEQRFFLRTLRAVFRRRPRSL